jgi:hypothetical protein
MSTLPRVALALGAAGAIPFIALAPGPHADIVDSIISPYKTLTPRDKARAQVAYGAVIVSFLGGIHWGLASAAISTSLPVAASLGQGVRFAWSVIPSLVAWPSLLCEERQGSKLLAGALATALAVDVICAKKALFPRWMIPLRIALSTCACLSLLATANSDFVDYNNRKEERK